MRLGKVPLQQEKLGYAEQTRAQVFKADIWRLCADRGAHR